MGFSDNKSRVRTQKMSKFRKLGKGPFSLESSDSFLGGIENTEIFSRMKIIDNFLVQSFLPSKRFTVILILDNGPNRQFQG